MHQIQNWDKSNLQEYLLYDNWEAEPALGLLAGFDYLGLKKRGIDACYRPLDQSLENDFLDEPDANATRLINSWERSYNKEGEYPPSFFIEWALSIKITPPWLDWAIEHELYVPNQELNSGQLDTTNAIKYTFDPKSTTYSLELDLACQAWRAVSSTSDKGKPKARIGKWLRDNTDLSKSAIERVSVVANWEKVGGATPT